MELKAGSAQWEDRDQKWHRDPKTTQTPTPGPQNHHGVGWLEIGILGRCVIVAAWTSWYYGVGRFADAALVGFLLTTWKG